jgi:hypothetical protein
MLRRTPFKRKPPQREARPDRSAEFASWQPSMRKVGTYAAVETFSPAPKDPEPVRDKDYLRLVASLRCVACSIGGASQAAHPNAGKAKARKACDLLAFPLCHEGANGCHRAWDNYQAGGRDAQADQEPVFAQRTQAELIHQASCDQQVRRVLVRVGLITEAVPA